MFSVYTVGFYIFFVQLIFFEDYFFVVIVIKNKMRTSSKNMIIRRYIYIEWSLRNLGSPHWSHIGLHLMQFLVELVRVVTQVGNKVGLLLQELSSVASRLHKTQ